MLAHLPGGMGEDLVIVLEFDAEHRIREQFGYNARKFQDFFFGHRHLIPVFEVAEP